MEEESSTLAFSAASLTLCRAMLSVEMSSPCCGVGGSQRERGRREKKKKKKKQKLGVEMDKGGKAKVEAR